MWIQFPFPKLLGRFIGYNLSRSTPLIRNKYNLKSEAIQFLDNNLSISNTAILIRFSRLPETIT